MGVTSEVSRDQDRPLHIGHHQFPKTGTLSQVITMILTEDTYTCELSKATQEIAQKELNETNKLRKKALADVRKWIKSQPHIRRARLDSSFILRFWRSISPCGDNFLLGFKISTVGILHCQI